ncbi:hypothetical protein FSP39_003121 [Pinctada imbricata]|uniref:Microtubule-associated protein n=1 Tax=Pinctada imbricata TaxID=66713 RepID=A0AA88YQH0_PINIB|nr:hypothetical protein FSP39_003121 [Pinctada imbricata]
MAHLEDFETEKVTEVSEGFDQFQSSQEIEGKISSDTHENVESSDHFIEGIHETVESSDRFVEGIHETVEASDHFVEGIHETVEASDHVKENTHGNVESSDNLMEDTHENVEVDDHAMEAVDLVPEVDESTAVEEGQTTLPETDVESDKKNILDFEQGRGAIDVAHPFPVTPQGVPPPITPEYQEGEEMLPAVVGKQVDGVVDQSIGAEPVENGMGGEGHEAGVNGDIQDDRVEVEGQDIGKSEREMTDNDVEVEQKAKDGIRKGDSVVIESEGSDMEERSITPDPNQIIEMQEKLMKDKTDLQSEENSEVVEENKDQDLMSASMHESINLEKGQAIEDLQDESSDDMPVVGRESGTMEGSFILEEGQTVDDLPQGEGSMMGGSFIMEQGKTIEDLEDTGVHEASSGSPDEEIPVQLTRSAMEDSVILDEGQTFDDEAVHDQMTGVHDQMTGSMMAGSMVLGEGETLNNQQYQPELEQADESSSTEIHPPSGDIDVMTGSVNVMAGSMFLDESEQLEDTFPQSDTSKSAMEGSMVLDEGETLEDRLPQPETKMSASFSESYSESQAEESSLLEQEESRKEAEEEILPSVQAERVYTEEETKYQQEAAQNMVENVLNDAIDKVESMQRETVKDEVKQEVEEKKIEVEETKHVNKVEEKKTVKTDVEKKEEIIKSKHVTEKRAGRVKTKTEKEKKNESVVIKETKKTEKKVTEVKKEDQNLQSLALTVMMCSVDCMKIPVNEMKGRVAPPRSQKPKRKSHLPPNLTSPSGVFLLLGTAGGLSELQTTGRVKQARRRNRGPNLPRGPTRPLEPEPAVQLSFIGPRKSSASSQKKKYGIDAKNDSYKPGGGRVKIFDQKVQVKASSRIDVGSKTPPGGTKPVNGSPKKESPRPKPSTPKGSSPSVKNVSSRIGSLDNARHTPGGGKVNIVTKKTDYSKVSSRVGSTANMDHRPGGGDKKIQSQKLDWKTGSRIGSLDNATHAPGGGNVKITDKKLNWSVGSRVGSLDNAKHSPGGGNVKIESRKVDFKDKAHSKVGSTDNIGHKPTGGTKKIETQKLEFKDKAKSRVDAKSDHKPGGGDKKLRVQQLMIYFKKKDTNLILYFGYKERLAKIISNAFTSKNGNRKYKFIVVNYDKTYFVKEKSDSENKYTETDIIQMLNFLIDNIFVVFGGKVFQQIVGIPMGTNCAPLLADIFLYSYEAEFIQSLVYEGKRYLASDFNFTYRYIDDVLSINNPKFAEYLSRIYPSELEVKETTETNNSASYLDIMLSYDTDGHMNTSLYDKRDDFNFSITNFPFLSSNIPSSPAYGAFTSQLIRYARASTKYTDFVLRARRLSDKLLSQGYVCDRLTSSLRKFYGRYGELVIHYDVPLSRMVGDILS